MVAFLQAWLAGPAADRDNRGMWSLLLFALLSLTQPAASPQEPPTEAPLCGTCADQGFVDCRKCKPSECSAEEVLFCSVVAACKTCEGSGREECKRCDRLPTESLEARRAAVALWRAERQEVDAFMERELVQLESAHFVLVFDVRGVAPGRKKLDKHTGAHLYLERLEALHTLFTHDLGVEEKDWFGKTVVMLWQTEADQERASPKYTLQPSNTASKLMGANPVVSIFYDKAHMHEEYELHQAVVHHVTHCLLSNVFDGVWPGNIKGGWIDGGLAHSYEVQLFDGVRHYCYVESDSMGDFKFGAWERTVLAAANRNKELSFLDVTSRHTSQMTPEQHMFAWSFVDYVRKAHPDKLGPLARGIKQKVPIATLTQELFEESPFAFHESWKAFVKANYSSRKKKDDR